MWRWARPRLQVSCAGCPLPLWLSWAGRRNWLLLGDPSFRAQAEENQHTRRKPTRRRAQSFSPTSAFLSDIFYSPAFKRFNASRTRIYKKNRNILTQSKSVFFLNNEGMKRFLISGSSSVSNHWFSLNLIAVNIILMLHISPWCRCACFRSSHEIPLQSVPVWMTWTGEIQV